MTISQSFVRLVGKKRYITIYEEQDYITTDDIISISHNQTCPQILGDTVRRTMRRGNVPICVARASTQWLRHMRGK